MTKQIVIFGTGEIAELAHYYFNNDEKFNYDVVAFTADDQYVNEDNFNGVPLVPVSKLREIYPPDKYAAHVALSYNKLNKIREEKYYLMKELGYELVSYVCSKSVHWPDLSIGDNCFILENQTIQPTVTIGDNVMIWSGNHLGHGCNIEDHVYISSHVCIAGHVNVGKRSFLGVNCAVKDFVSIGEDNFVTMGANVVKNTSADCTVTASEIFESENIVNKKLKKKYFNLEM